jgi:XTP/dITP diphosphohydrolase
MTMDLLIGTSNVGKLNEIREMLAGLPVRYLSLPDVGLAHMEVEENATTLEENARIKAEAYAEASRLTTLADDTGLIVDALNGAPGIYPARYGGPGLTMAQRRQKVLDELVGVPDERRTARFVAVMVVVNPVSKTVFTVKGICEGRIAQEEAQGGGGFGYDPMFIPQGYSVPFSLLSPEEKNRISHRGLAMQQIIPILKRMATEQTNG